MTYVNNTDCCALMNLRAENSSTLSSIISSLNTDKKFTIYCITTQKEKMLEKRLLKLGFEHKYTFPSTERPKENLKMWFVTLSNDDIKKLCKKYKR